MSKKTENFFFDVEYSIGIEYCMTINFFVHVRIIFKYLRFFFQDHRTKIDKNRGHNPPPQNPCFGGGSDAVPSDFSGNVVGGKHTRVGRHRTNL